MAINSGQQAPGRTRLVLSVHFGEMESGGELAGDFASSLEKLS